MRLIGHRNEGTEIRQVEMLLASQPFIASRLEALKEVGAIVERDGKLIKRGRAPFVFHVFLFWRRLLKLVEHGG